MLFIGFSVLFYYNLWIFFYHIIQLYFSVPFFRADLLKKFEKGDLHSILQQKSPFLYDSKIRFSFSQEWIAIPFLLYYNKKQAVLPF